MVLPTHESDCVIVVPGDPDQVYTCITAKERPFASHCWIMAANHIRRMKDLNYFERMEAAKACDRMAEAVSAKMRAPQRIEPVPGFSWNSFKTIKPIK